MLEFLDYPRQSVWNMGRGLSDMLRGEAPNLRDVAPGGLGALLGVGLGATGIGIPLALLAGTGMAGLAQGGMGREAMRPEEAVKLLGMDPESMGGTAASLGLGLATDPLSYLGGIGAAKGATGLAEKIGGRGEVADIAKGIAPGATEGWATGASHVRPDYEAPFRGPGNQLPSELMSDPAGHFNELDQFTRGVPFDARQEWPPMGYPDLHQVDLGVWDHKLKQLGALPDDMPLHPDLQRAMWERMQEVKDNGGLSSLLERGSGDPIGEMSRIQGNEIYDELSRRIGTIPLEANFPRHYNEIINAQFGRGEPHHIEALQKMAEERGWPVEPGGVEEEVRRRATNEYANQLQEHPLNRVEGSADAWARIPDLTLAQIRQGVPWRDPYTISELMHSGGDMTPLVHVPGDQIIQELIRRMKGTPTAATPEMEALLNDREPADLLRRIIEEYSGR